MSLARNKSAQLLLRHSNISLTIPKQSLLLCNIEHDYILLSGKMHHYQRYEMTRRCELCNKYIHRSQIDKSNKSTFSPNSADPNKKDQNRKANLGAMIDDIKLLVPNLLTKSLPKSIVSNDVLLRICPTHFDEYNSYLPTLKGHVSYYTTCKTLQLILTSIILSPKVKLHIQSIRTSKSKDIQCVYPTSTKIYVRWSTCPEGCIHLSPNESINEDDDTSNYHSTSDAKLGSHRWSKLDTMKILKNTNKDDPVSTSLPSITTTISQLTTGLIGLTKESEKLERVISGVFIFELNEDNDQIIVHTIEDVNVIERTATEDIDGELRIC